MTFTIKIHLQTTTKSIVRGMFLWLPLCYLIHLSLVVSDFGVTRFSYSTLNSENKRLSTLYHSVCCQWPGIHNRCGVCNSHRRLALGSQGENLSVICNVNVN